MHTTAHKPPRHEPPQWSAKAPTESRPFAFKTNTRIADRTAFDQKNKVSRFQGRVPNQTSISTCACSHKTGLDAHEHKLE